ncbi:MAG: endolytic transglycosylase MltG [Candidatus Accumulibacter sp.]|jgi:UPF0755 protein|nr:endolytic transglycosylase MltG [Accumulibacter sp.]
MRTTLKFTLSIAKWLFIFGLVILLAGGWLFYQDISAPLVLSGERADFQIRPGSGLRTAIRDISKAGVTFSQSSFLLLGKIMRAESEIKAGNYEIQRGITLQELLDKLVRGDVSQTEITFIEGWTFRQMRERLNAHPDVRHETRDMTLQDIMRRIGAPDVDPEGRFFPDTYLFAKQSSDIDILARAFRVMRTHLAREWEERQPDLPYSAPDEALIMASIIEKETGRARERPMIASVFVNRLRKNMPLQTDPTVIYGIGEEFDGNLRKQDLLTDTPYNTYTRAGLPPTPIAMPGLASLRAALNPAKSTAFYFVARGDGSSQFSDTLEEHNRAVDRYQRRGRRENPPAGDAQDASAGAPESPSAAPAENPPVIPQTNAPENPLASTPGVPDTPAPASASPNAP